MHDLGVFTTIKVLNGVPLFFDKHKNRIHSHAKQLGITPLEFSKATLLSYLKKNNLKNCALKITLTNTLFVEHRPLPKSKMLKVITVEDTRDKLKTLKTTNRAANNRAKKLAEEKNADDALFIKDSFIIESTYANVFSIDENENIITPPIDGKGLNGIARQVIMERTLVKENPILKQTNSPLVLVNSLRVQTVKEIDNRILPDATKLAKKMEELLQQ